MTGRGTCVNCATPLNAAVILCEDGYLEPRLLPPTFGQRFTRADAGTSNYSESGVHVEIGSTVDEARTHADFEDA